MRNPFRGLYPPMSVRACVQMAFCGAAGGVAVLLVDRWLS